MLERGEARPLVPQGQEPERRRRNPLAGRAAAEVSVGGADRRARPSLRNRLLAGAKREVSTANLAAFERAGASVFELDLIVDERRRELQAEGTHPWEVDSATASLFLAVWVARVHQTLGSELLTAAAELDPGTRGFVPPQTYKQVWAFFQPVAFWLTAARQASATDDYWWATRSTCRSRCRTSCGSGTPRAST